MPEQNLHKEQISNTEEKFPADDEFINATENPSPQTTQQINTVTESQTSENMEVHHHPHVHHKKKWSGYLFEFVMLFFAVSAGFFVENLREEYVENHRAKQYASFLYDDLIKDTVNLTERTDFMMTASQKLDTLITLLKSFKEDDSAVAKIYTLSAYVYTGPFFSVTTSTMEQLKNSGSLRYFRSNDLIRKFSKYDTDLKRLKEVEDRNIYLNAETRKFLAQFLDLKSISRFTVNIIDSSAFKFSQPSISTPLKLYKNDRDQFEQLANLCALKQLDWNTRVSLQIRVLNSARNLIASLKEEYHLE